MDKRGIAMETVVGMIVIIVVFIILFPMIWKLIIYALGFAKGGACGASMAAASLRKEVACFDIAESPIRLKCPRRHLEIGQESTTIVKEGTSNKYKIWDSKKKGFYNSYTAVDGEVVTTVFAQEMLSCWQQFDQGKSLIVNQIPLGWTDFPDSRWDLTGCFVCSEIYFSPDIETKMDGQYIKNSDVREYITKATAPSSRFTYLGEFNSDGALCENLFKKPGTCWENLEKYYTLPYEKVKDTFNQGGWFNNMDDSKRKNTFPEGIAKLGKIDPTQNYAVIFVRKRYDKCEGDQSEIADNEASNWVYAVPTEEVNRLCDHVMV